MAEMSGDDAFIQLFEAIAACEAPSGTQVDDVLAEAQPIYDQIKGRTRGKIRCLVRKDTNPDPMNCWYYNVDVEPVDGSDLIQIDYGSLPTMSQAMAACEYAVTHRDEFDNPEV